MPLSIPRFRCLEHIPNSFISRSNDSSNGIEGLREGEGEGGGRGEKEEVRWGKGVEGGEGGSTC